MSEYVFMICHYVYGRTVLLRMCKPTGAEIKMVKIFENGAYQFDNQYS